MESWQDEKWKISATKNRYFRVQSDVKIPIYTGEWEETQTYYGVSQLFRKKQKQTVAKPGDEIHDLVGGRFLISGSKVHSMPTTEETESAFERLQHIPLPMKALKEINQKERKKVQYHQATPEK